MARPMPPPLDSPSAGPARSAPPTPSAEARASEAHPPRSPSGEPKHRAAKRRKAHKDATSIARDDLNETRLGCRICSAKQRNPFRRLRGRDND